MRIAPALDRLRRAGAAGLDLLLPPGCMGCDAPASGGFQLCAGCFGRCHFITDPFCRTCGVPFSYQGQGGSAGICSGCREQPPLFRSARAALAYDQHSRGLILPFKHGDRTELARLLGPMMARAGAAMLAEAACLIPVPLHASRLRQRGYNQAALLAREVARQHKPAAGRPALVLDALVRLHKTAPLGPLDAAARRQAMAGAIGFRPDRSDAVAGRNVVLVDDVMTSGATANACAAALLAAGAARVNVLVAARVPDPALDH